MEKRLGILCRDTDLKKLEEIQKELNISSYAQVFRFALHDMHKKIFRKNITKCIKNKDNKGA